MLSKQLVRNVIKTSAILKLKIYLMFRWVCVLLFLFSWKEQGGGGGLVNISDLSSFFGRSSIIVIIFERF